MTNKEEVRLINANGLTADLKKYYPDSVLEGIEPKTLFNQILHDIDNAPTVPLPDFKEGYKQAILDDKTNFRKKRGEQ